MDITTFLALVNILLSIGVIYDSIMKYTMEQRHGYRWMWFYTGVIGGIWFLVYILEFIDVGITIRSVMGTGAVRAIITFTIGGLLGMLMQLRISRRL